MHPPSRLTGCRRQGREGGRAAHALNRASGWAGDAGIVGKAMQQIAAILNRLSIAVQFAVVVCLFGYFVLLWRMVKLREVRLWTAAWLADALALAAVFVHAYASISPIGHRMTLVVYLAGKAAFAILIVAGARVHLRPGVEGRVSPLTLFIGIAVWSLILGFAVPSLWQARLAEGALVGSLFCVGAIAVLVHPRSTVSRWLGWAMLAEGVLFLLSAALLAPGLWGNRGGFTYLTYASFFDAWVELMLALSCIAVIAKRREELLHYANRELLQSQQRLRRLVDTDPLTNLSSRRSFRKSMDSLVDTGGAFIFIDINRFKQINELFGHSVGDATLQRLANLVVDQFRPGDHAIRWGGDEFLVVAPGMNQASAKARVAAIREAVKRPAEDCPAFSIAVGISELEPGGDPTAALEEADRRMFAEKRGR
jgi:diguanylate cyclase (GGDEF)-like protein